MNRANVQTARQNLELSRVRLSYTSLYAPKTGWSPYGRPRWGSHAARKSPVVTIAEIDHLWLRGYINESGPWARALGPIRDDKDGHVPGKEIQRPRVFRIVRRGIHAEKRGNPQRAGYPRLPD